MTGLFLRHSKTRPFAITSSRVTHSHGGIEPKSSGPWGITSIAGVVTYRRSFSTRRRTISRVISKLTAGSFLYTCHRSSLDTLTASTSVSQVTVAVRCMDSVNKPISPSSWPSAIGAPVRSTRADPLVNGETPKAAHHAFYHVCRVAPQPKQLSRSRTTVTLWRIREAKLSATPSSCRSTFTASSVRNWRSLNSRLIRPRAVVEKVEQAPATGPSGCRAITPQTPTGRCRSRFRVAVGWLAGVGVLGDRPLGWRLLWIQ